VNSKTSPVRLLWAGLAWRSFGSRRAAEALIQAMSGDDEQNRMLAGMALVKAGGRSLDLIEEQVEAGRATPAVVRLLPDLDTPRTRVLLNKIASQESGELAEAARGCLNQLRRMDG
jgi:hypothetical protein